DPYALHKKRPLAEHLEDYRKHLEGKGDTPDHVELTLARVRALLDGCKFVTTADLEVSRAEEWLTALRKPGGGPELPDGEAFKPGEVARLLKVSPQALRAAIKRHRLTATGNGRARVYPRATVEALLAGASRGASPETVNHYVRAVRG